MAGASAYRAIAIERLLQRVSSEWCPLKTAAKACFDRSMGELRASQSRNRIGLPARRNEK